ncbi:MAG: hypothetical protein HYY42_01205, partial [Chloroflexi bacterium]|nr:hypothetical protein [Chloroflexota bacterium]
MPERARRALVVSVATVALSLALAGAASAHDCSSPRDCEQTAGYNAMIAITGGVVAVGAGLIGVYVGTSAGALPVVPPAPRPPATPIAPPPGGPLVDGSGNTIPRWEPGKYGADSAGRTGRPGDP